MLEPEVAPTPKGGANGEVSATNIVINPIPPSFIGELAKPIYPPAALAAHAGECVLYVTITIDPNGTVSEVAPSWQRVNVPSRYSDAFLDAVKAAVRSWKFEPARNVYWEKDAGGDLRYLSTETLSARTDIKFTFEASGAVR
jgi:outer membrane biosynthesis protein TonB